jgi:acylphosphatase
MVSLRLEISGRVQGVGFRYSMREEAMRRGVRGWVRNRRDGSVEALFCGPASAVREMIEACRSGPPHARVEALEEVVAELFDGDGFVTLPTE